MYRQMAERKATGDRSGTDLVSLLRDTSHFLVSWLRLGAHSRGAGLPSGHLVVCRELARPKSASGIQ